MLLNQPEPGSAKPTRRWPAERIERSAIERLIPYADDARLRSEAEIDELANSRRQWGSTIPVHAVNRICIATAPTRCCTCGTRDMRCGDRAL